MADQYSVEMRRLEKMFSVIEEQPTCYNFELILLIIDKAKDEITQIAKVFDYFFRTTHQKYFVLKIYLMDALIRFTKRTELKQMFYEMCQSTITAICIDNYDLTRDDLEAAKKLFGFWKKNNLYSKYIDDWLDLLNRRDKDTFISLLTNKFILIPSENERIEDVCREIHSKHPSTDVYIPSNKDIEEINVITNCQPELLSLLAYLNTKYGNDITNDILNTDKRKVVLRLQQEKWMPANTFSYLSGFVTMKKKDVPPEFIIEDLTYILRPVKRNSRSPSPRSPPRRSPKRSPKRSPRRSPRRSKSRGRSRSPPASYRRSPPRRTPSRSPPRRSVPRDKSPRPLYKTSSGRSRTPLGSPRRVSPPRNRNRSRSPPRNRSPSHRDSYDRSAPSKIYPKESPSNRYERRRSKSFRSDRFESPPPK